MKQFKQNISAYICIILLGSIVSFIAFNIVDYAQGGFYSCDDPQSPKAALDLCKLVRDSGYVEVTEAFIPASDINA